MAARTWSAAALGFVGAVAASSGGAAAEELVVMPFHCRPSAIGAMLTPADNIGHRVIGRRETTTFTACSPVRPDQCRRWTIHRFDMECGGVPVAWTDVVAAGASRPRSAWVEDGVLYLRMPNWWGLSPDDPCAGPQAPEDRWRPGLARQCAMRAARASVVAFPPGFAPTLDLDAIFVDGGPARPPSTGLPSRPGPVTSAPIPERAPPRPGTDRAPPEPPPERAVREAPKPAPSPPPVAGVAPPPQPVPAPQPARPIEPTPKMSAAEPPVSKTGPQAAADGTRIVPKIINADPAAPDRKVEIESAASSASVAAPVPAPIPQAVTAPAATSPPVAAPPSAPVTPLSVTAPSPSAATTSPPWLVAGLAAGVLAALALLGVVLARRGGSAPVDRDIASVRFQSAQGRALIVPEGPAAVVPERAPPQPSPPSPLGDRVPTNAAEALAVLGMGVAPQTDLAAVKRLVDALRFSWHPDRAENEQDRAIRVLRLQQINAAWDILARGPGGGGPHST